MFGRLFGEIVAAPVRVVSAAAKVTEATIDFVDPTGEQTNKKHSRRNCLDYFADDVSGSIEGTLDRD